MSLAIESSAGQRLGDERLPGQRPDNAVHGEPAHLSGHGPLEGDDRRLSLRRELAIYRQPRAAGSSRQGMCRRGLADNRRITMMDRYGHGTGGWGYGLTALLMILLGAAVIYGIVALVPAMPAHLDEQGGSLRSGRPGQAGPHHRP